MSDWPIRLMPSLLSARMFISHTLLSVRMAIALILCLSVFDSHATCLPYEPTSITLSGKLERKTFPGQPNYESVATGDDPETGFYLVLASPLCAVGVPNSVNTETHTNVRLVQLTLNQQGYAKLRPLIGKNIHVRGQIFGWQTGHHHTPLLLEFEGIGNER